jgi:hypothetical protein
VPAEEFEGHFQALYPSSQSNSQFGFASHRPEDRGDFLPPSGLPLSPWPHGH